MPYEEGDMAIDMTKISVIIPVYNCERSIEQSIKSVQRQSIKEIEIICINDGSTDGAAKVICQMQKEDERILVYEQENQGSGAARNLGLYHAKGEFIAFLDADDYYLDPDALESMYEQCKRYQVSVCGTGIRIERGGIPVPDKGFQVLFDASQESEVLEYSDFQFDYGYYGFIFERQLISENQIRFPLYRRFQDPVFLVRAMYAAKKFCFLDKALYVYCAPNVLTRFHVENVIDLLHGLSDNLQFAQKHDLKKLFMRTAERIESEYLDIICHSLSTESLTLLLEINQMLREGLEDTEYVIKPLDMVFESVQRIEELHWKEMIRKIEACDKVYPYGAGRVCSDFLDYLRQHGLLDKVNHVLVTSLEDNPDKLQDIPVMEIKDYQAEKGDLIVVTVVGIYQKEVIALLEEHCVSNYDVIGSFMNLKNKEL